MKICAFADTYLPTTGGAQTVLHNLATQLTTHGDHFSVLAPFVRGRDNRLSTKYSVDRYHSPLTKRFGVRQLLVPLGWHYLRHRFDVLHCHSAYPCAYVAATFKRVLGIPFVVRPYGGDVLPESRVCRHPRLRSRVRASLEAADVVIAQGHFLRDVIRDLGVPDEKIQIVNNGVDLEVFSRGTPFPHPCPYLLGMGNLVRRKGFDLLIQAYAKARPSDVDLLIAGDGIEREKLEKIAAESGVASRIRFLGRVEGQTKIDVYRSAVCAICPSRSEPFSNVILEALASGLPVIASATGGNFEQVKHGEHGLIVPTEDVGALANAITTILSEPQLLNQFRAKVPAFIQRFDWPQVALQYRAIYESVLGQRVTGPVREPERIQSLKVLANK
jgi:glycosyltransferase involved in cell wall biosynthesis